MSLRAPAAHIWTVLIDLREDNTVVLLVLHSTVRVVVEWTPHCGQIQLYYKLWRVITNFNSTVIKG